MNANSPSDDASHESESAAMLAGRPLVTAAPGPLPLLYLDDDLVIADKPSGLSAHRGWDGKGDDFVLTRLRDQLSRRVYLMHRLDRATSGAMAAVFDPRCVEPLQRAMQCGAVDKRYLALARGRVAPSGFLDYPVRKGAAKSKVRIDAQSAYWRRGLFEGRYALVEVRPLTGRLHQVRRHLRHLGAPILGDTTYGDHRENKLFRERFALMRLALHAWKLRLPHPRTGVEVQVESTPPDDLRVPLEQMGLWPPGVPGQILPFA